MRKTIFIILLGLISTIVNGQKFETRLALSPLMTFKSNQPTENKIAFGFSGAVQAFYKLNDHFAVGSEIMYSFENYKFTRNFEGISIPESTSYYEGKLRVHSIKTPLILRFKTTSAWSLSVGYGLAYNINYTKHFGYI